MRRYVVDGGRICENIRAVKAAAGEAVMYAVLKADGYGLGLAPMARALAEEGVDHFAVTEPAEAKRLARMDIPTDEILLLRPAPPKEMDKLLKLGCVTFSVGSPGEAAALARAGVALGIRPRIHVQVDTGMGRYGFRWDEPGKLRFLYESFTAVSFTGIYTHFSCPGSKRAALRQFRRFTAVLDNLKGAGIDPGLRHCCNSAALFRWPEMRLDAVRVGSALIGRVPGGERFGLRSAGWCEAAVETVRDLPAGSRVGYGASFRARRDTRAAVVTVGSVHGLGAGAAHGRQCLGAGLRSVVTSLKELLRGGAGLTGVLNGVPVPVLGQECSECAILDVTGTDCAPGDVVRFSLNPMYCRGMERVWLTAAGERAAGAYRPVA